MANGVRSISAAAFAAAWNMLGIGIGENSADVAEDTSGCSTLSVDIDCAGAWTEIEVEESLAGASVGLERLALDAERRIVGVRSDSRAFGSSNAVYFPMAGRVKTCKPTIR